MHHHWRLAPACRNQRKPITAVQTQHSQKSINAKFLEDFKKSLNLKNIYITQGNSILLYRKQEKQLGWITSNELVMQRRKLHNVLSNQSVRHVKDRINKAHVCALYTFIHMCINQKDGAKESVSLHRRAGNTKPDRTYS